MGFCLRSTPPTDHGLGKSCEGKARNVAVRAAHDGEVGEYFANHRGELEAVPRARRCLHKAAIGLEHPHEITWQAKRRETRHQAWRVEDLVGEVMQAGRAQCADDEFAVRRPDL